MTPEQLKLADKIEAWSPEKWKPLTLNAHERRLAVAALRATPDARVKEALELAVKADEIHANCDECGGEGAPEECEFCFPSADDARIARRAALSHQPGTGEAAALDTATVEADYTAWLIEINDSACDGPRYFQFTHDDDWTLDHNAAAHFSRKKDADRVIEHYGWTLAIASEHCWPKPVIREVIAESNGHHWIKAFNLTCCRDCEIVRRSDNKNKPCKGAVKIGPRALAAKEGA